MRKDEGERTLRVGGKVLLLTVTHYWTGVVREITPSEVVLDKAAWIPDTGRLADCVKSGVVGECEPVGDGVEIGRGTIAAVIPWRHALPEKQK